ncbi:MAG: hypothetical protein HON51_10430 [Gammaproteobacteria bacterium]|nr:hypothetical protein [Gammaproteobacteria bacterium]MBT5221398.1 hypothetical protein [Gammaproteobacteria bacterium]MBT5825266.1 hypothetical protein [Gammaproteobacteria bacterium]MBT5966787.1 hypothetical protein [Gammaproteobacteria bacterium]MBT6419307.1 hypothetical protein [Gammaproteobacteria bacterium]
MSTMTKTWWGQRLLDALEDFTDSGRLVRGRSYASDNRVKQWDIKKGVVQAKIRGNKNPYFGVYTEPTYKTQVQMVHLSEAQWKKIIAKLTQRASFIVKLLVDEIPENIEEIFAAFNTHLLPNSYKDFKVSCDCPDYAVPCKHIAGVCYRLAADLDHNPLLLFEMRGLSPEKLHQELIKSPLGKILADAQTSEASELMPVVSLYTRPELLKIPDKMSLKQFWRGEAPLPKELPVHQETIIPAVLIKKGGDYPSFWHQQSSFIEVMEDFYIRMRKNNQKQL